MKYCLFFLQFSLRTHHLSQIFQPGKEYLSSLWSLFSWYFTFHSIQLFQIVSHRHHHQKRGTKCIISERGKTTKEGITSRHKHYVIALCIPARANSHKGRKKHSENDEKFYARKVDKRAYILYKLQAEHLQNYILCTVGSEANSIFIQYYPHHHENTGLIFLLSSFWLAFLL